MKSGKLFSHLVIRVGIWYNQYIRTKFDIWLRLAMIKRSEETYVMSEEKVLTELRDEELDDVQGE